MQTLTQQNDADPIAASIVKPAEERVLFAFCEKDRQQFFPSYRNGFPGGGQRTWVDSARFSSSHQWTDFLEEIRPTILISCWSTPPIPDAYLQSDSFSLRYLCHTTGTVRYKVSREFIAGGGIVTNWGNVISHNVAEHALLLLLASLRNMTNWRRSMATSNDGWGNAQVIGTSSLRGKRVGIHGFGNVATELVRLLAPFDVECFCYSHNVPTAYMQQKGVTPCASLKELFQKSQVIVECEALTEESKGSVTEELLRLLPDEAVFVNVARGALVDENALMSLALEGRIRVASDVFEQEPLPSDSPFYDIENVIISPHIAGPAGDWFHRCGDYALNNVGRYLEGQSLNGIVTLEIYDRST